MIKFDKIKIISSLTNISNINEDKFKTITKDGVILEQSFSMQSPFAMYIEADYEEKELVLEITGKILKDKYPQLISIDTINQCLQNINEMGLCHLNIEEILIDGKIVKCDVTQDVYYPIAKNYARISKQVCVVTKSIKRRREEQIWKFQRVFKLKIVNVG